VALERSRIVVWGHIISSYDIVAISFWRILTARVVLNPSFQAPNGMGNCGVVRSPSLARSAARAFSSPYFRSAQGLGGGNG